MSDYETEGAGTEGADELAVAERWTGGEGVAVEPVEPHWEPAVAEPAAVEPVVAQEAPAWSGISEEEWRETQQLVQHLTGLVAGAGQQEMQQSLEQARQEAANEFLGEPWEEGYEERLAQLEQVRLANTLRAYLDQRIAPVAQLHQELEEGAALMQADSTANEMLDETFSRHGVTLDDELRGSLREAADEVLPHYRELLLSEGVPEEAVYGEAFVGDLFDLLAGEFAPQIQAANQPPGDEMDTVGRHAAASPVRPPALREILSLTTGPGPFKGPNGPTWVRPREMY